MLRASDVDRERALRELKAHYAEGRLTIGELESRVEKVYRSVTRLQISAYLRDLPVRSLRTLFAIRARRVQRTMLRLHAVSYLTANAALIAIWELAGKGLFWPALLLVPSTALFAFHAAASHMLTRALGHGRR